MPYVSSSGVISPKQPWGLAKIIAIFWSILNFFFMFAKSLWSPFAPDERYARDHRSSGGGGGDKCHHVTGESDLSAKLREAGNKLVAIDFFAQWCGPCKMIAPHIEQMAAEMSDVVFLKVDVDECDSVAAKYKVRAMPTFVFIKNNQKVEEFSGANLQKLREVVQRYR